MQEIFVELAEFAGADYALLYSAITGKGLLRYHVEEGSESDRQLARLAKRVCLKKTQESCADMSSDKLFQRIGKGSFICSPLIVEEEVLGAVFLGNSKGNCVFDVDLRIQTLARAYYAELCAQIRAVVETETRESSQRLERYLTMGLRFGEHKIIGIDPVMEENVFGYIERYSTQKCSPVFIYGESGTGKELVASALHYKSERSEKDYLPFNCAEFGGDPQMQRVEIFGCTERIAPGVRARKGLFQLAHGGTLFLDEVGSLSQEAQGQLLRVLESQRVRPVGAEQFVEVDVRLICANNRPLHQLVREGTFRKDLYYRFSAFIIHIPALRDRGSEDINLLIDYFLDQENNRTNSKKIISHAARAKLHRHQWPGNVRELRATLQRAFYKVSSPQGEIGEKSIEFTEITESQTPQLFPKPWEKIYDVEREFYSQVCAWASEDLKKHTKTLACEKIGLGKNTLNQKLKRFHLEWPR